MDYKKKVIELLEVNLTEKAFNLWVAVDKMLPDIWNHPTSSTGKYHKKLNGEVPTQAEHVYHLLYSISKLLRIKDV